MVKVIIIHEGNENKTNDNELLKLLISQLDLDLKRVLFIGMGSKSNFFKRDFIKYKRIKQHILRESVGGVLFVIDADYQENDSVYGGYDNTKEKLNKIIEELELKEYSDIYITCDPNNHCGYLESLILSTIPKKEKDCIENFLECSDFKSKDNHKAILNQIYKMGYPNAPFDFTHSNFNELKDKLRKLFEETQ